MKITQIIKSNNALKLLAGAISVIVFFFGLSFIGTNKSEPAKLDMDFSGFNKAFADSATWTGVRSVATVLRAANVSFNTFYAMVKTWGILYNYTITAEGTAANPDFYFYVSINNPKTVNSSIDTGVTYTNSLQLKHGGSSGDIALQFFFDSPDDSGTGDGCLLIVNPYYFEAVHGTIFSTTATFEARVTKPSTDKIMYLSYSGSPWKTNPPSYTQSGRAKLVGDETNIYVTCLAYVNKDGSAYWESICPLVGPTLGWAYYTLAFIAKKDYPHYSTALWGWDNSGKANTICGGTNIWNYGHFNAAVSGGWVCDGVTGPCPDGDPYPTNSSVQTLYDGMLTGASEEFNATVISSLNITFQTY